ncbi:MAG: VanZ family protein [Verrucomicrobiae bacterium]|nr:VanZ family protein [Verrucomicrobiae bacterium]
MKPKPWAQRAALWGPVLLWMGLIFYLSSLSSVPLPQTFPGIDKVAHLGAYSILGFFIFRALRGSGARFRTAAFVAVIAGSLYGASDEWHQSFVPGRDVELGDWLADTAGAALAILPGAWIYGRD